MRSMGAGKYKNRYLRSRKGDEPSESYPMRLDRIRLRRESLIRFTMERMLAGLSIMHSWDIL